MFSYFVWCRQQSSTLVKGPSPSASFSLQHMSVFPGLSFKVGQKVCVSGQHVWCYSSGMSIL